MSKFSYQVIFNKRKYTFSNDDRESLKKDVISFLNKNNINFTDAQIENNINRFSGEPKTKSPKRKITLMDAFNGARALVRYTKGDSVSAKEMKRRAAICKECPMSSLTSGCMACGAAAKATKLLNVVRSHKNTEEQIPDFIKSRFCDSCGCSLPLLVVTKFKDFYKESDEKNNLRPDNCWLKKTSTNFTNE